MALLVGTIIQSARVALPDQTSTLGVTGAVVSPVTVPGSTLFPGTYYVVVTARNPWGETLPSQEYGPFTVGHAGDAGNALQVSGLSAPGATFMRAYITQPDVGPGTESVYFEAPIGGAPTFNANITISTAPNLPGLPPTRNSAYNPDSDGFAINAMQMYRWLNEGLTRLSRIIGGVMDYSGVGTVHGQPYYVVTGQWLDIQNLWYNGWWIQGGDPGGFYKRNPIPSSILSRVAVSIFDDRCILEVNYQPDRTAGITFLSSDLGPNDTFATVTNDNAFYLVNGFAKIGTEIVAYAGNGSTPLHGLIRRLGGTYLNTWPAGTMVLELNLFFQGRRILDFDLQPGSALLTLPIPAGWCSLLVDYIIARFRGAEQNYEEEAARLQQFDGACRDWAMNRTVEKHVQVGGNRAPLSYARTIAGGIIIPAFVPIPCVIEMLYSHGRGTPWLLSTFMFCSILVPMWFAMWERRKILRHARYFMDVCPCPVRAANDASGSKSFAPWDYDQIWWWLKNAMKPLGKRGSASGLPITEGSGICSMPGWEVPTIHPSPSKSTRRMEIKRAVCRALRKLSGACVKLGFGGKRGAIPSAIGQKKNCAGRTAYSSAIPLRERSTNKL